MCFGATGQVISTLFLFLDQMHVLYKRVVRVNAFHKLLLCPFTSGKHTGSFCPKAKSFCTTFQLSLSLSLCLSLSHRKHFCNDGGAARDWARRRRVRRLLSLPRASVSPPQLWQNYRVQAQQRPLILERLRPLLGPLLAPLCLVRTAHLQQQRQQRRGVPIHYSLWDLRRRAVVQKDAARAARGGC